jgi:hypothetical protein
MERAEIEAPEATEIIRGALKKDASDDVERKILALHHEMSSGTDREDVTPLRADFWEVEEHNGMRHVLRITEGYRPLAELAWAMLESEGYDRHSHGRGTFSTEYDNRARHASDLLEAAVAAAEEIPTADELQKMMEQDE